VLSFKIRCFHDPPGRFFVQNRRAVKAWCCALFVILVVALPLTAQAPNTTFYMPVLQALDGSDLGVALLNPSTSEVSITLTARSYEGTLIGGTGITNPKTLVIPASEQRANRIIEIFGSGIAGKSGWVEMQSGSAALKGFFLVFDASLTYIDGAELQTTPSTRLIFPKVQSSTIISFAYTGTIARQVSIGLYGNEGELFARKIVDVSSRSGFSGSITSIAPSAGNFQGYAIVELIGVSDGLVGFETYRENRDIAALAAPAETSLQKTGYLPHLASQSEYTSTLTLVNPTPQSQTVRITAAGLEANGASRNPSQVSINRTIPAFGRLQETVEALFNLSDTALVTGYIRWEVQSATPGVIGLLDYGTTDGVVLSAVAAPVTPFKDIYFSHIAEGQGYYTGLAFLNPGSTASAVTVEAFNANGASVGKTGFSLDGGGRKSQVIRALIPKITNQLGGYVHVTATAPIFATELFGSTSFTFLANVSAQGVTQGQTITPPAGAQAPSLVSIFPFSAQKNSTTALNITGSGFTSQSVVLVDSVPVPTRFANATSLSATYTASASGVKLIAVWNPPPGGGISNITTFNVNAKPAATSIVPLSASIGQTNVPFTINGIDLNAVTDVRFVVSGSPDPGITISSLRVDPAGTQATFTATIGDNARPGPHFINLNTAALDFFGGSFMVFAAGAAAVYTMTPDRADLGQTVTLTMTGTGLASITSIRFGVGTGGSDPGITVENFSASDTSIRADVIIGKSAVIGPHFISLGTATNSSFSGNMTFYIGVDGLSILNPSSVNVTQGAAPIGVTINGTGLDGISGIDLLTPAGDVDTQMTVGAFKAEASSITATLAATTDAVIGPRFIAVRVAGTRLFTSVNVIVGTPSGIAPSGITPTLLAAGQTRRVSINRNSSFGSTWNITGLKFQLNGLDDESIVVTDFQTSPGSVTATVAVSQNAAVAPRTVALIADGATLPTTLLCTVGQGITPGTSSSFSITSLTPSGATLGQTDVPLTIIGPNLSGTTNVEFSTSSGVDAGITVSGITVSSDGTQVDATMTIFSNAAIGLHQLRITRNGRATDVAGAFGLSVYAAGTPALYALIPDSAEAGQSLSGFKATGTGLAGFKLNFSSPGSLDHPTITLLNPVNTGTAIQGTLNVGADSFIGQHGAALLNAKPEPQSSGVHGANVIFNVTRNGVRVDTLSLSRIRSGDSGIAFAITGSNLSSVSGVAILNPDGSPDNGIVASSVVGTETSVRGNMAAEDAIPIGPRFIVLNFSDGTSVKTTFSFGVQTQEGLFLNFLQPSALPPNSRATVTISESVPWGIIGIKFLRNGVVDNSIQVSGFTSSNGTTSINVTVAKNAPLGARNVVLIGADGRDIPTSSIWSVVPNTGQ
jgi:hypothetical protein